MDLGTFLVRKATSKALVIKHERAIRLEHDLWAQTADLGVTYYTTAPVCTWGPFEDAADRYPCYGSYQFDKVIKWGLLAGQLQVANSNATSWQLWFQHGPLTTTKMPTADDYRRAEEAAAPGEMARAQAAVAKAVEADLRRLYPTSAELLARV